MEPEKSYGNEVQTSPLVLSTCPLHVSSTCPPGEAEREGSCRRAWELKASWQPNQGAHTASACRILHPVLSEYPGHQRGKPPTHPHGVLVPRKSLRTSESTSTVQTQPVGGFPQRYNLAHIDPKMRGQWRAIGQGDQSTGSSTLSRKPLAIFPIVTRTKAA